MGRISKVWQSVKSLVVSQLALAIVFITTGLVVNAVQFIMYITILPFNPTLYRRLNYYVTYTLNSQVVFLVESWAGSTSSLFGDPEVVKKYFGNEHALLLINHGCEVDWLMGWAICDRMGVLGNAKVYAKRILRFAPVLGWSWIFQENVFLDRDWEKDRRTLGTQLTRLAEYPDSIWLTIFPEGTRLTPNKYAASMEIAKEKGLPILKHHLLPRTRGFVASIPYLRKKVAAIYDVIVAVDPDCQNEPSVYSLVKGRPLKVTLLFRRIPLSEVPEDEKEAANWLHKLFQQKDKLLDNFIRTGEFSPPGSDMEGCEVVKNFEYIRTPLRWYPLINFVIWATLVILPLAWVLLQMLVSGSLLKIGVVLTFCATAYFGLNILINLTRISKSSEYGVSKQVNGTKNGVVRKMSNVSNGPSTNHEISNELTNGATGRGH